VAGEWDRWGPGSGLAPPAGRPAREPAASRSPPGARVRGGGGGWVRGEAERWPGSQSQRGLARVVASGDEPPHGPSVGVRATERPSSALVAQACPVRRGALELHACCVMGAGGHALLRSPIGMRTRDQVGMGHGKLVLADAGCSGRSAELGRVAPVISGLSRRVWAPWWESPGSVPSSDSGGMVYRSF